MKYSAWFLFDNHTTQEIKTETPEEFLEKVNQLFIKDRWGCLSHVNLGGEVVMGKGYFGETSPRVFFVDQLQELTPIVENYQNFSI